MSEKPCYCQSKLNYNSCCAPYINSECKPKTAEALMRSRYTAFCLKNATYIKKTMKEKALKQYDEFAILNSSTLWINLNILYTEKGAESDEQGIVVFHAFFKHHVTDQQIVSYKEKSFFKKIHGDWFCVNGDTHS